MNTNTVRFQQVTGERASRTGHRRHAFTAIALVAVTTGAAGCMFADDDDEPRVDLATCGSAEIYRIDRVEIPVNQTGAYGMALDVDRDGQVDNRIGSVAATLTGFFDPPFELAAPATRRLETDVSWKLALRRCAGDHVAIALGRELGATHVVGDVRGGAIRARGKAGEAPISALFDPLGTTADPGWLASAATALELSEGGGDRLEGVIVVAPRAEPALSAIARPMTAFLRERVATEPYLLETFDSDRDGEITQAEVEAATITRALLAPDLHLGAAGDVPALSYGLRIRATRER